MVVVTCQFGCFVVLSVGLIRLLCGCFNGGL